jgi:hypothetical protein
MDRKPGAKIEAPVPQSREPHSIRFTPTEWEAICGLARARLLEPAVLVRALAMYALSIVQAPGLAEAALGNPGQMLAGAPRTLRF